MGGPVLPRELVRGGGMEERVDSSGLPRSAEGPRQAQSRHAYPHRKVLFGTTILRRFMLCQVLTPKTSLHFADVEFNIYSEVTWPLSQLFSGEPAP